MAIEVFQIKAHNRCSGKGFGNWRCQIRGELLLGLWIGGMYLEWLAQYKACMERSQPIVSPCLVRRIRPPNHTLVLNCDGAVGKEGRHEAGGGPMGLDAVGTELAAIK
ncbi:unnamed protein product [Prunus armeniaca]